jgi:hypothetical protein
MGFTRSSSQFLESGQPRNVGSGLPLPGFDDQHIAFIGRVS